MSLVRLIVGFVFVFFLSACGGGTSGTGLKTYEGRVLSSTGAQLSNVLVTIESTGDSSTTTSSGLFVIKSTAAGESVALLFESEQVRSRVVLPEVPEESSLVTVSVVIDTETNLAKLESMQIRAWFAGLCDHYFENRDVIRQANHVPDGTICSLNVEVSGDGRLLSDYPVELQYAGCGPGASWRSVASARTGTGRHAGYAEINFRYRDSPEFCRYRVVPLKGISAELHVAYPIDTFTEQEYYATRGAFHSAN